MLCRLVNVVTNVQKIKQYTIQILIKVVKKVATGSEMPGASAIGTSAISKINYQILHFLDGVVYYLLSVLYYLALVFIYQYRLIYQ